MELCGTLDVDVTIRCYYGDSSSCDNTLPTYLFYMQQILFAHTFVETRVTQNLWMAKMIPWKFF